MVRTVRRFLDDVGEPSSDFGANVGGAGGLAGDFQEPEPAGGVP